MITFTHIADRGSGSGSLLPLASFGAGHPDADPVNESSASSAAFAPLTSHGFEGNRLEPLQSFGADHLYGAGSVELEALTVEAYSGLVLPDYAVAVTTMVGLTGAGHGISGGVGQATLMFQKLRTHAANYAYSAGIVSFEPLISIAYDDVVYPDLVFSTARARVRYHVTAPTSLEVETEAAAHTQAHAIAGSAGTVSSGAAAHAAHHLLAASTGIVYSKAKRYAVASSPGPVAAAARHRFEEGETWLINAVTFAASRVDGYYFDTLARLEGSSVYGAGPDGIFEFTGGTDDGAEIAASIVTRREDFGVPNVKGVAYGYVTGTSDGKLEVRVFDDQGRVYTYETERALGDTVRSVRFKTGKGLEMHEWQWEIRNKAGGELEIHHFDVLPAFKRRVKE
jgi:hypothetical protein